MPGVSADAANLSDAIRLRRDTARGTAPNCAQDRKRGCRSGIGAHHLPSRGAASGWARRAARAFRALAAAFAVLADPAALRRHARPSSHGRAHACTDERPHDPGRLQQPSHGQTLVRGPYRRSRRRSRISRHKVSPSPAGGWTRSPACAAAVVVYRHGKHQIDLFVWADRGSALPGESITRRLSRHLLEERRSRFRGGFRRRADRIEQILCPRAQRAGINRSPERYGPRNSRTVEMDDQTSRRGALKCLGVGAGTLVHAYRAASSAPSISPHAAANADKPARRCSCRSATRISASTRKPTPMSSAR